MNDLILNSPVEKIDLAGGYCGCGQKSPISTYTWKKKGYVYGRPRKFIRGHNMKNGMAPSLGRHYHWQGGIQNHQGYVLLKAPGHPLSQKSGYIAEHILIASQVLGKPLPENATVHHINHVRSDNRRDNLVICQNNSYHILIHRREEALSACGRAGWRKCYFCQKYDAPTNLYHKRYHHKCWLKKEDNYGSTASSGTTATQCP